MKTSAQSIFNFRLQSIVRQVICTSLIFVLFFIQSTPVNAIGTRVGGSITDWDQVPNDQKILWAADHLERVLIDEGYFGQYVKVLTQEGHYAETTAHGENGVVDVPLVSLEDDWTHDPIFGQFMSFTVYAYSDFVVFSVYTGEETIGYHWKYDWEGNRLPYTDVNALDTLARDLTIGEFVYCRYTNTMPEDLKYQHDESDHDTDAYTEEAPSVTIPSTETPSEPIASPDENQATVPTENNTVPDLYTDQDDFQPQDPFSLKYTYSFSNYFKNFVGSNKDRYFDYLSDGDKMALHAYLNIYFANDPDLADNFRNALLSKQFFGCCFGLSMTEILNYYNDLDVVKNFGNGESNIAELGKPINNSRLRSMLFSYHLTQYLPDFLHYRKGLEGLVLSAGNAPVLICYSIPGSAVGHAVVGYGVTELNDDSYEISIFDCNSPDQVFTCTVSSDFSTCIMQTYNGHLTLPFNFVEYISDEELLSLIDLDGATNDGIMKVECNSQSDGSTFLFVRSKNYYTITNADGETLIYDNGELYYEMAVNGMSTVYGYDEDGQTTHIYRLDPSAAYTFTSDSTEASLSIVSSESFATVTAKNSDHITLTSDGAVRLHGDRVDFTASLSTSNGPVEIEGYGMGETILSTEYETYAGASDGGQVTSIQYYETDTDDVISDSPTPESDVTTQMTGNDSDNHNAEKNRNTAIFLAIILIIIIVRIVPKRKTRIIYRTKKSSRRK